MNITQIADEHGRPAFMSGTAIDITEQRRAEEVLRQSESQLRLITDNVPAMIVYVDAQRRYRFVNERFTKWRSVSREQVLGRPVRAVLGDELYAAIEPHLSAALAGEQVSYERRGDRPGEPEWRSVTYVPDRDARGAVQGVYALIHDITQQKRTEQTLRESEERWQRVLTEMPVLLDAFDAQGNIVVWNRECERVTGYAASEVIGNPDAMRMFYPDAAYRALVLASIRQEHGDHHNVEFELTCKDGSRRTIAWSSISGAVPIPGWATWGVGIDVTERERAEAALRASEKMFRTLAETVPAAIMIGRGDSMRYANETAARIAGCTLDEFLARSPWAFVHPDHQELVRQRSLARQAGQPAPSRYEIRVAGKDGGERWLDMSVATVEYEGWPASLVAALDITERKQAEEAARQHQEQLAHVARVSAVGEMASGLAHELAQPLTAILYFAKGCITRLTSGAWGPAEAVRTLEKVAAQAERAGVFIRQLKTFVRKAERQRVRSDLNGIVREARTHHVDVRLDLAQELPAVVVDPVQIEQVLLNLARNGIEALAPLPAEQRVLTIRTVRGPDDTVQVSVSDSGPGVPPESVPLVFDPFFTTKPGGTGLGLSISRSLVEAHNGKLWVEGGPAGGAVFSFVLPVAEGAVDAGR
jgi:PAS domain S-box-containing protein